MNYETTYKQELKNKLENKGLSQSSINLYLRNLEKLNDDQPLKNLSFLNNVSNIMSKLENYKENTKRLYLIAISSILNVENKTKLYDKYFKLMIEKNKELKKQEAMNEKTPEQNKNWIEWEKIIEKRDELKKQVETIKGKNITEKQYNDILKYLILSLYTHQPPRRNSDYQYMNVVKINPGDLVDSKNYLIINDEKFIFNKYKTQKKFGQQEEKINKELMDVIMLYLKYHPNIKGKLLKNLNKEFLVYYNGKPLDSVNSITRILNSIFDKQISSSMLRHIYLSSKYQDVVEEQKKDALRLMP